MGRLRLAAVNRSAQKTPGNLPLSTVVGQAESAARMGTGGGRATGYERSLADSRLLGWPAAGWDAKLTSGLRQRWKLRTGQFMASSLPLYQLKIKSKAATDDTPAI